MASTRYTHSLLKTKQKKTINLDLGEHTILKDTTTEYIQRL